VKIAGAPISWGVSEVPGWGKVLDAGTVLAEMASLGLRATELGPPDYLPVEPSALKSLLDEHGLALVGPGSAPRGSSGRDCWPPDGDSWIRRAPPPVELAPA
jgi:sugar phosphate isomerase/epimerase